MRLTNIVRALFLPLTLCFLAIGCILMLIGAANWFQIDPRQIQRDGLQKQLDFFSDCDLKGQQEMPMMKQRIEQNRTSEGGGQQAQQSGKSAADLGTLAASRCNTQQRPYKWLLLWTGASVGLTFLLLLWMVYRAPSGLLQWLGIQCAIVLVLVVLSIYAGMQLQSQTKDLVDCQGYDEPSRAEIENNGFTCYSTVNRPQSLKSVDHWSTIFWVGTGFAMGGLGLLMLLVPVMHWAKIRLANTEGGDPEEGYYHVDHRGTGTTGSTSWWGGGDRDHDRSSRYDTSSDRDRWGRATGVGGGLGTAAGQRGGHRREGGYSGYGGDRSARDIEHERESAIGQHRQPSVINRMTGGYFDREHGGGPETRQHRGTGIGGDRDRDREYESHEYRQGAGGAGVGATGVGTGRHLGEHEHALQRDRTSGYQPQQQSFMDRMTGRDPNDQRGIIDRMTGRDPNDQRSFTDRVMGRGEAHPSEHRGGPSYDTSDRSGTTYSHSGPTSSGMQTGSTGGEHVTTTTRERQPATATWGSGGSGSDTSSRPIDQQRTTTTTVGSGAV